MFCVDFGKRCQVTCRVAFLGLTFPTLSIERLLELWLVLPGNSFWRSPNEVFGIINFVAIHYEKSASRNASLRKKKHFREEIY